MTVEQALDIYLKVTAELTNRVGRRIHCVNAPQGERYPYLVFTKISDPPLHNVPARAPRVQFSIHAKDKYEALEIAHIVSRMLQRFKGTMGGVGGVRVKQGVELNSLVLYESRTKSYHIPLDFQINYLEA